MKTNSWITLAEKAHCRFGDKGDTALFVLAPYDAADYDALVAVVTPSALREHFGGLSPAQVTVTPCPQLGALVLVLRNSLGGGVTRSLALDIHGKTRSSYLLGMRVPWPTVEPRCVPLSRLTKEDQNERPV
ncbi:MAG TPA: hypothetical protein P5121_28830 [Caldilineaceae bacterium]|mgnify:CR=1 FL=1|nr:hypothetical protein [Caldilineaceae bacterium]